ncbi:MAG: hypothetical protein HY298_24520 [Verrucomicrobia bacterium]|nr:hypothetical protein [Verrucomicrobiota bacterium]
MNVVELERKLIAAARATPPNDRVPYAFEKRIMAHLDARPVLDGWTLWGKALWRATAPCVAIMLALGVWTIFSTKTTASTDLTQDFENTMLAAVDQNGESW